MQRAAMRLASIAGLAVVLSLCLTCVRPGPPAQAPRDGVFIHVSSGAEDAHRVLMALRMAELMAVDRDVLVYFDIKGIEVVLADAPDLELAPFPSSHSQLRALADRGVPLLACPGCLEAAGKRPEDLRAGVRVAEKDAFFDFTDGRILTLDY